MYSRSPYWWDPKNIHPWFWQLCCIEGSSEHYSISSGLYNEAGITNGLYSFLLVCNLRLNPVVLYWWPLQSYIRVDITYSMLSLTECCHYLWFGYPHVLVYRRTPSSLFLFSTPNVILFLHDGGDRGKSTTRPYTLIAHLDPILSEWLYEANMVSIVLRLCNCSQSDHPGIWLCSSVYVVIILMPYHICGYLVGIPPGCESALLPCYSFTLEVLHM